MTRYPFQFGISSLMWLVAFAALNFWMFSFGAWGVILALAIDKHLLVAYFCMLAKVDQRKQTALFSTTVSALQNTNSRTDAISTPAPLNAAPWQANSTSLSL